MGDGYRNKGSHYKRDTKPPRDGFNVRKVETVTIGNHTVIFIRDAVVVFYKWQWRGKTYRMKLKKYSPNWRKARAEAIKVLMKREHTRNWFNPPGA